jgi:glycosyltransferase involved in cell wall biosynthesis
LPRRIAVPTAGKSPSARRGSVLTTIHTAAPAMLTSLTLWSRRHTRWLPAPVRAAAKRLIEGPATLTPRGVETWAVPLVVHASGGPAAAMPAPATAAAPGASRLAPQPRPTAPGGGLRCLIVSPVLDAGGIDEFVAFLARNLPAWGIDTTVLCAAPSQREAPRVGLLAAALGQEGIAVAKASPADGRAWLSRHRPDVISAHAPPGWFLEAAAALGIPVVETLHAVPTPIGTDWSKEPARSRHITAMVAVSELVRQQYLRGNPGFGGDAVATIPNAFNETARAAVDRAQARAWLGLDREFLFVSLARHVLQKNAYGLVAAFAEVARAHPDAHLAIAGRVDDALYTEEVRRLRDRSPGRERIHLRENLSHPSALLAAADGFVLNSFFEGWPLASMEALAAGLPVVMSEVGGAREQVGSDGGRGYVVPNPLGDPEHVTWEAAGRVRFRPQANQAALVEAMAAVIRDRDRWAANRPELAVTAKQRFSTDACAEQHALILRRATAGSFAAQRAAG